MLGSAAPCRLRWGESKQRPALLLPRPGYQGLQEAPSPGSSPFLEGEAPGKRQCHPRGCHGQILTEGGGRPGAPGPALCSELTVKSRPGHTGLGQRCPGGSVPAHAQVRPRGERHRGPGKPLHPAPCPAVVPLLASGTIPAQGQGAGQDAQGVLDKDKDKDKDHLFPQPPDHPARHSSTTERIGVSSCPLPTQHRPKPCSRASLRPLPAPPKSPEPPGQLRGL